jgi:OCT family organic cation transporter-like MFS transporter 4/5
MAELCPTLIRSTAIGLGATASKIGGLAAPFIAGLGTFQSCIPLIVFGSSSVVGGAFAVVLPETLAAPLPQTLEEVIQQICYSSLSLFFDILNSSIYKIFQMLC